MNKTFYINKTFYMNKTMKIRNHILDFNKNTYVMGIINCTPDSFYPGSRKEGLEAAFKTAEDMITAGVHIIDIGGESSRPGSDPVSADEEIERVIPVIKQIRAESDIIISIDTVKPEVAQAAVRSGADIINDISGFKLRNGLDRVAAENNVTVILMHMRGTPKTMQEDPHYNNTIKEIYTELNESVSLALNAGIKRNKIIIDPGIGFGKRYIDNLIILKNLKVLKGLGIPILIGLSRKSFLGEILNTKVENRMVGSITANTIAVINGANIVRVHDYSESIEMIKVINAVYHSNI